MATLDGTGRLADDLWFLSHTDEGRPRLHPRAVGLGLAAALLGEVVLFNTINVRFGIVEMPYDALTSSVVEHIRGEPTALPVRDWLAFLGKTAGDSVAERLTRAGLLARAEPRTRWRAGRWAPINMSVAAMPTVRLRTCLNRGEPLPGTDAMLAGLARAAGLMPIVFYDATERTHQYLDHALSILPDSLRELIRETEAAVGNAIAAHRI